MTDLNRLIEQVQDPSREVRIAAAGELAFAGGGSVDAQYAVWWRFVQGEDPVEVRTMRDALTLLDPNLISKGESRRRFIRDRQSYQDVVRGYDPGEVRQAVDQLLESLQQVWPESDDSLGEVDDSVVNLPAHIEAMGLEMPAAIPRLLDALRAKPVVREMLTWILGRIGRDRPVVGELAVPLLGHKQSAVVDAAADVIGDVGDVGDRIHDAIRRLLTRYRAQKARKGTVSGYALESLAAGKYEKEVNEGVRRAIIAERDESCRAKLENLLDEIACPDMTGRRKWRTEVALAQLEERLASIHSALLRATQIFCAARQTPEGKQEMERANRPEKLSIARKLVHEVQGIRRSGIVLLRWLDKEGSGKSGV